MTGHVVKAQMARRRHWAGIWSRHPLTPLPDPHGASAMAEVLEQRFCSSILPWRSCGSHEPWVGTSTAERTMDAVDAITRAIPTVWGGDWNHALEGREYAGSKAGRDHLLKSLAELGLRRHGSCTASLRGATVDRSHRGSSDVEHPRRAPFGAPRRRPPFGPRCVRRRGHRGLIQSAPSPQEVHKRPFRTVTPDQRFRRSDGIFHYFPSTANHARTGPGLQASPSALARDYG
jgi:hypothetical protein